MHAPLLRYPFLVFCILALTNVQGHAEDNMVMGRDFSVIDSAAVRIGPMTSLDGLARALGRIASDDMGKARALYRWMTAYIAYDMDAYFDDSLEAATEPQDVLRKSSSVCTGFASLFQYLAEALDIEVATIEGRVKGYSYELGDDAIEINHDWNAIRVDGVWRLIDVTWGAGSITDSGEFEAEYDPFWFDTDPGLFVLWHLPAVDSWQLLERKVSYDEFLAKGYHGYARYSTLASLGVSSSTMLSWYMADRFPDSFTVEVLQGYGIPPRTLMETFEHSELVECHSFPDLGLRDLVIPITRTVRQGNIFSVSFASDAITEAAIINNGEWTSLTRNGSSMTASIVPEAGTLFISIHVEYEGETAWWRLLEYEVD